MGCCRQLKLAQPCGARVAEAAALHEDHPVARGVEQPAGAGGHVGAEREVACERSDRVSRPGSTAAGGVQVRGGAGGGRGSP